jgi:hypothetical protein
MEYVIKESKLFNAIYQYLDSYLNPSEMDWVYGFGEDEDGYSDMDIEDENFLIFYKGEYEGEENSDIVFNYFDVDFYDENDPSHKPFRNQAPVLEIMGEYAEHLDNVFNEYWEEPMKKWFQDNFNLPVKSLSTHY